MIKKIGAAAINNPLQFALAAGVLVGVVYLLTRTAVKEIAGVAGGIVSGNNAVTEGTNYEGTGVLGTLGAVANEAGGGIFDWLGGKIADGVEGVFGLPGYDPSTGFQSGAKTVADGARATDALWGPIGSVQLRRK